MKELIDVFRMSEISIERRINVIIKLGEAINHQHGANLTEGIVYELVYILNPDHEILKDNRYSQAK